jgi:PHS family inorganic phosphate transporter-like MFS transporter
MIILASTFTQALAGSGTGVNIIAVLIVWRFIMGVGVGVGGDHPLGAVIASEFASTGSRGRLMTTASTALGWGNFGTQRNFYMETGNIKLVPAVSLVALMTVHACRGSILANNNGLEHVDYCWRILVGLGCVPGAIALYFRLTTPETPRFTMDIDRVIQKARTDTENVLGPSGSPVAVYWVDPDAVARRANAPHRSRSELIKYIAQPGNLSLFFGAAYSWLSVDASTISYIG